MQYNTIQYILQYILFLSWCLQYNIIHIARDKRKEKEKEDPEKKTRGYRLGINLAKAQQAFFMKRSMQTINMYSFSNDLES